MMPPPSTRLALGSSKILNLRASEPKHGSRERRAGRPTISYFAFGQRLRLPVTAGRALDHPRARRAALPCRVPMERGAFF